ncbi:MAG TPA: TRAP transporter small permease subunit [SAR324 cluster bacterium]|nr:TRAP transporter small permease subunit [SAR324 cluster bacterium]MDP7335480.1 TRAP transporter small permease subunit [SAR324 cluster bacterium]MDP7501066.1 TRAP transporter small permease subunit [SAR324 cluster bacterium]MEE1577446.1 TRAP transporter small permease subunit [Deltaproteobacteria bacterium]HJO46819.1 TRAP transporter small permease subunit [SAR324 cluster bacterium]
MSLQNERLAGIGRRAAALSTGLSWIIERCCVVLMTLLVLDVWLGIVVRYLLPIDITFTEEAARYLMIWTALLAVSSCISRRDHIGVLLLFESLSAPYRSILLLVLDTIGFIFFTILFYYGIDFAVIGANRYSMIFGMSKFLPFLSVPVAAGLACIQIFLVAIRDQTITLPEERHP